ncbi:beta-ketoacyl-[acyl-carrier-protein] synthase family protein [soil metagenome]
MPGLRLAISGIGIVSALGWSAEEAWRAIVEERSGLGPLTLFPSPRCGHVPVGQLPGNPAKKSGFSSLGSRSDHMAVIAAREACAQAGILSRSGVDPARVGVVLGASTGGMLESEQYIAKLMTEKEMNVGLTHRHECACSTDAIAETLDFGGPRLTVCTACASGATAIATAADLISSGAADVVVAGGVDSLTRLTLNGFSSLLVVAQDGCRPFDASRAGMSLGEGAGILVIERMEHAAARGVRPLALLRGHGAAGDAHHATAPAPDGGGVRRAMHAALAMAKLNAGDVDYVNAHGTGTAENDPAEAAAFRAVFTGRMPAISSTKRYFGHTLAAAGAIEAAVCVMALRHRILPPNLGLEATDPLLGFEPVRKQIGSAARIAMSTSLGFGGMNAALLFERFNSDE